MSVLKETKNLSALLRRPDRKPEAFLRPGDETDDWSVLTHTNERTVPYTEKTIKRVKDFEAYRFIFETAIEIFEEIFEVSRSFPQEKKFLTEHIRKYAGAVCTNLAEAWHMKKQKALFLGKLSAAAEAASQAQRCLEYASKCRHIDAEVFRRLDSKYEDIFDMLCDLTGD